MGKVMTDSLKKAGTTAAGAVVVQGVCFDANSSFKRGAAGGPTAIREALFCGSANLCAECGFDLGASSRWQDAADLKPVSGADMLTRVEQRVLQLLGHEARVLCLGGDHSITFPILRAYGHRYPGINILHLDAHPDLYDELAGNRYSHACPFARIMEEGLAGRLVQVGIRTMNRHQRRQARRFGVEVVEMSAWHDRFRPHFDGPVYLSIDLDVLDPAFAPGVSHHEPGGLSTRDVIGLLQRIDAPVVGAHIVEYNPDRDIAGMTAMVAAKLLKEVVSLMAVQGSQAIK
jgi:agmatinase